MGALALFLVLAGGSAYAAFDPVGSDGDIDACYATKGGALSLRMGRTCGTGKKSVTWSQTGPRGPAGSPAASMLTGWVRSGDLPMTASIVYPPLGRGTPEVVGMSPNATVVLRDLAVKVEDPPGAVDAAWDIVVGSSAGDGISCRIRGFFATQCDSGGQAFTLPPHTRLTVTVFNENNATPSNLQFAYRAVAP
jgi:hypothetical protein